MNALTRPLPDAGEACEPLLVLRMRLTEAHAIARSLSLGDVPAAVQAEMTVAEDALMSLLHDSVEPALAIMQRLADETEGELEAAHIAAQRRELRAGSGVRWGR